MRDVSLRHALNTYHKFPGLEEVSWERQTYSKWENNIKMNLLEIGCVSVDLINLAHNKDK
jgi:hypothetical protein